MSISSLNENMNIVQSLVIPGIDTDMDIIQKLDDEPNDVGGLTAQELKAEFDKAGNIVKTYINETLLPSISDTVAEEEQRAQAEAQRQANELARQQAEEQRANETSGIVAQATAQAQQAQQSAGAAAQSASSAAKNAAQTNADAAAAAQNAARTSSDRQAIQSAIDNIPPGSVPVINNLTTGGISAALSAEQGKILNTALSNKADNQSAFLDRSKTITGSVLEAALTLEPGLYIVDTKATDTPVSGIWYYAKIYDVFSDHRILELYSGAAEGHKEIYYNTYNPNDSDWKGWYHFATATPPQEYDLSLTGATGTCKYSLDQFGVVKITGLITRDGGTAYFGTLPEGYRPVNQVIFACCGFTDGNTVSPCTVGVDPDGRVWVNDFGGGFTKVPVNMYFLAGSSLL